jgi:hypothetical protein
MAVTHPATVGIKAAELGEWLKPRPGDEAVLKLRAALIATKPEAVLARSAAAEAGVLELAAYLSARDGFKISGDMLPELGRRYAEDICILTPDGAQHILSAAVLCFPNRWRLADKAGKPILAVHGPVPEYAEKLSSQVDFFLGRLRPGRCFTRDNWGLVSTPVLHLPDPVAPVNPLKDEHFYVRREEQSFVKLPNSGVVVFTIRTSVTPWAEVSPADRAGVLEQAKTLSTEWLAYKSMKV